MSACFNTPILLTSAIRPVAGFTVLQDSAARLDATIQSIHKWIELGARKIVICDGSGFLLDDYVRSAIQDHPEVTVECLAFQNDARLVSLKGKGFGEGQIVSYALEKSVLIKESDRFAKCTSKIWVENFSQIPTAVSADFLADVAGFWKPVRLDTRFYVTSIDFYRRWLIDAHEEVDDGKGYFLEHAFLDRVIRSGVKGWIAVPSFRAVGLSGTAGIFQQRGKLKSFIRDWRNKFFSMYI